MGYAVELYFDPQTQNSIWDLRYALTEQGILSTIGELGDKPHVSLAVFSDVDCDRLILLTKEFARELQPFNLQLSAISTFPTDENTLFLSPVPTQQLLRFHQEFHRRLAESRLTASSYYLPGNWVPHCTIEMNIPDAQFPKAVEVCKKAFKPLLGQFREIGVIEFRPIKHLANWPFG